MTTTHERPERAVPRPHAVVGVGLVVLAQDGRVLLGQAHDGRWELPGGKVDPGRASSRRRPGSSPRTDLRAAPEAIRILSVQIDAKAGLTRLTAAAVTTSAEGVPAVTEPHKITRWQWFAPAEIPSALYAPSAAVLRAWRPDLTALPHVPSYDYPVSGGQPSA